MDGLDPCSASAIRSAARLTNAAAWLVPAEYRTPERSPCVARSNAAMASSTAVRPRLQRSVSVGSEGQGLANGHCRSQRSPKGRSSPSRYARNAIRPVACQEDRSWRQDLVASKYGSSLERGGARAETHEKSRWYPVVSLASRLDREPIASSLVRPDWAWALGQRPGVARVELSCATLRVRSTGGLDPPPRAARLGAASAGSRRGVQKGTAVRQSRPEVHPPRERAARIT